MKKFNLDYKIKKAKKWETLYIYNKRFIKSLPSCKYVNPLHRFNLNIRYKYQIQNCFSRFRLSNNKLNIELGRHYGRRKDGPDCLYNQINVIESHLKLAQCQAVAMTKD